MNARHSFALVCIVAACSAAQNTALLDGAAQQCALGEQIFDGGAAGAIVCATLDAIDTAIHELYPPKPNVRTPPLGAGELSPEQRAAVSHRLAEKGAKVVRPSR